MIEIKNGNKTTYRISEPKEENDWQQNDITTSLRRSVSMGDIPKDRWESIFGSKDNGKTEDNSR